MHLQAIYHHFDIVDFVSIHLHAACNIGDFPIHSNLVIALLLDLLKQVAVISLTSFHNWGEDGNFLGIELLHHGIHDLLFGQFYHFFTADITHGFSGTGKEQTKEIVYFCNSTNGTSWVFANGLLFDADNGAEASHLIDIRALHITNKLTGIGAKTFEITSLTFREKGIERK